MKQLFRELLGHNLQSYVFSFVDFLLCRQCGHEVAKAENLHKQPSPLAHRQRNDTILGVSNVLIQLFENPSGICDLFIHLHVLVKSL